MSDLKCPVCKTELDMEELQELYRNKCDQLTRFLKKIDLLERKLELVVKQRNSLLQNKSSDAYLMYRAKMDEELEELK